MKLTQNIVHPDERSDFRKALMEQGERLIQDEGVTLQPYWRSL